MRSLLPLTMEKEMIANWSELPIANWSELPPELLESVISKLDFIDIPRFSMVCRSWYDVSKSRLLPPFLMLLPKVPGPRRPPPLDSIIDYSDKYWVDFQENCVDRLRFWCPDDTKSIHYLPVEMKYFDRLLDRNSSVVGSSHGWLVVSDDNSEIFLFNPYSGSEIELPKMSTLPKPRYSPRMFVISHRRLRKEITPDTIPGSLPDIRIRKAILSSDPSGGRNYRVVLIHGRVQQKLAYCRRGDRTWRALTWEAAYSDVFVEVACYDNKLYAITPEEGFGFGFKIYQWDLTHENPIQTSQIVIPSSPLELDHLMKTLGVLKHNLQFYLVPTLGETFLVARLLGTRKQVGFDFDQHFHGDMTLAFQVFKVNFDGDEKLVMVESLADRSIFLGRNNSMMVSARGVHQLGLKENSIYFTDYEDKCFYLNHSDCGHDTGIYSLSDRSLSLRFNLTQYRPVPLWILPGWK